MDAMASVRVSEFMNKYVNSDDLDPSQGPQHQAGLEEALAEFRLLSDDQARIDALLGELGSQRGFLLWINGRIQEAEQRGEATHMLKWDRGLAAAKIQAIEDELPGLLGPSLETRLASSRESFRRNFLDSGALGRSPTWAGDDPTIQDALDGMLIPESARAVVNQYLYSIARLQHDSASLAQALAPGGTLAQSPQHKSYALTLADWQAQASGQVQAVMGILKGTTDPAALDPVPWSDRTSLTAAARPPVTPTERKAFLVAEDTAWLAGLSQEARSIESALAAIDAQQRAPGRPGVQAAHPLQGTGEQRYALVQRARLVSECMQAVRTRLASLHASGPDTDDGLSLADLAVADARRRLDALSAASPASAAQAPRLSAEDEATYNEALPPLRQALAALQQSQESLMGMADRLARALVVPRGFKLSESQRAEFTLLRTQRTELMAQMQLSRQESGALKALIDQTALGRSQGRPFDHEAFMKLTTTWEAARSARLQGEEARQGALTTPPPTFVAWQQSVRSSQSRVQTVVDNYLLNAQANASVRDQIAQARQTSTQLRADLRSRDAAIQAADARVTALTRQGASAADKADVPSAQAQLSAMKALRSAMVQRLLLVEKLLDEAQALRTSSTDAQVAQHQEAISTVSMAMPNAWPEQLRAERTLAQAEQTVAQRTLSRLQATPGASNSAIGEAMRVLSYREKANIFAATRVAVEEAERTNGAQSPAAVAAQKSLASAKEEMQAAYFDLVQIRLIYRTDALSRQLSSLQYSNGSVEEILSVQRALQASQVAWPRSLSPIPVTPGNKADAVQAAFGDGLPE